MRFRIPAYLLTLTLTTTAFAEGHAATTITVPLQITVQPSALPLAMNANPSNPTLACNTPAGTIVSAISVVAGTGDGKPVALAFASGSDTSYTLSSPAAPANVIVGPNGITAADCGTTISDPLTATQP